MSDTGISSKLLKMKFMQKSATLIPTKINNDHKQPLSFFMSARDGETQVVRAVTTNKNYKFNNSGLMHLWPKRPTGECRKLFLQLRPRIPAENSTNLQAEKDKETKQTNQRRSLLLTKEESFEVF